MQNCFVAIWIQIAFVQNIVTEICALYRLLYTSVLVYKYQLQTGGAAANAAKSGKSRPFF